ISSHILSELSLLCTDYLFINKGQILQAVSADELKKLCREYYHISTDNNSLAVAILQEKLGITQVEVEKDGSIRLYEQLDNMHEVSKTLFENGVVPVVLHINEANLEQYYMNMVGEENEKHN
ncbi:MAG: ABC transporter ATP-binding protein, partial [Oscillospiraceae bacterium]|nr:ABC transporter ATP-binding protein [Oscillospiraceae bacterium]